MDLPRKSSESLALIQVLAVTVGMAAMVTADTAAMVTVGMAIRHYIIPVFQNDGTYYQYYGAPNFGYQPICSYNNTGIYNAGFAGGYPSREHGSVRFWVVEWRRTKRIVFRSPAPMIRSQPMLILPASLFINLRRGKDRFTVRCSRGGWPKRTEPTATECTAGRNDP